MTTIPTPEPFKEGIVFRLTKAQWQQLGHYIIAAAVVILAVLAWLLQNAGDGMPDWLRVVATVAAAVTAVLHLTGAKMLAVLQQLAAGQEASVPTVAQAVESETPATVVAKVETAAAAVKAQVDAHPDLDAMVKSELLDYAAQRGITAFKSWTKADILAAIKAAL